MEEGGEDVVEHLGSYLELKTGVCEVFGYDAAVVIENVGVVVTAWFWRGGG